MNRMHGGALVLGLAILAGAAPSGRAQNPPGREGQAETATEPAVLTVDVVNQIPPVDRENLKSYWAGVESKTKDRWTRGMPEAAKPPKSTPGEVKIDCWIHTDGRVTGMTLEQPSGNTALDRAAWAAITGTSPYDAFPYGIAVDQVKVRFTFEYNGGAASSTTQPNPDR